MFGCSWVSKYLRAKCFTSICDHQPLESLFNVSIASKNKKLLRRRVMTGGYEFIFDYQPGSAFALKLEDYLSRLSYHNDNN